MNIYEKFESKEKTRLSITTPYSEVKWLLRETMHSFCSMSAKSMIEYNQIHFINLLTQFALCLQAQSRHNQ